MDKQRILNLTKIVYKLTLLFPKKEPLRYKMREVADNILEDFISGVNNGNPKNIAFSLKHLEIMDSFFEVAKAQNWIRKDWLLEVQKEYANLKQEIEVSKSRTRFDNNTNSSPREIINNSSEVSFTNNPKKEQKSISERHKMILAFLREQGRAQVWQIKEILPEVTKRTLRRDFEALLKQGLIERIGEKNNTFYQIKNG
jgi:hypothetical protein